jgi:hypothetical protein
MTNDPLKTAMVNAVKPDTDAPGIAADQKLLDEIDRELKVYDGLITNANDQIEELTAMRDANQRCRSALEAARVELVNSMPKKPGH